jgi:hypothetical protein
LPKAKSTPLRLEVKVDSQALEDKVAASAVVGARREVRLLQIFR